MDLTRDNLGRIPFCVIEIVKKAQLPFSRTQRRVRAMKSFVMALDSTN
jgi:hypothetical protein